MLETQAKGAQNKEMSSDSSDLKEPPTDSVEVQGQNTLRVQVAELCGWRHVKTPSQPSLSYWECGQIGVEGYKRTDWCGKEAIHLLPDYPSDLNVCAEFEKMLTTLQCFEYRNRLQDIVHPGEDPALTSTDFVFGATAEQRCRAFVATIEGKKI